jgi:hypothetical protein
VATTIKQPKSLSKPKRLFDVAKEWLVEPSKYLAGYLAIYISLRLADYGLMRLLISGYADQRQVQYTVFVAAVITGLAAQLLEILAVVVVVALAITLLAVYVAKILQPKTDKSVIKAAPDYALNRYIMTFGEKIERPKKAVAKPKKKVSKTKPVK